MLEEHWGSIKTALENITGLSSVMMEDLKPVAGGFSDALNFRFVASEHHTYLIRLFPEDMGPLDRERETKASQLAAEHGIAPKVFHVDDDFLIIEFRAASHTLGYEDYHTPNKLHQLIGQLNIMHSLRPKEMRPGRCLSKGYSDYCRRADPMPLPRAFAALNNFMQQGLEQADLWNTTPCFVHNDVNHNNVLVENDRFFIIDWTDAGLGDPYVDLAEVVVFLNASEQESFMKSYLGHEMNEEERARLQKHIELRYGLFAAWGLEQAAKACHSDKVYPSEGEVEAVWKQASQQRSYASPYDMLNAILRGQWSIQPKSDRQETLRDYMMFSCVMFKGIRELS